MSHGIPRTRLSAEAKEERAVKDKARLEKYLALADDVFARKNNKQWSQEAFDATTRLLQVNPELYSVWNYRRDIMLNALFVNISSGEIIELLSVDLDMTFAALRERPKVYWIWNHRRWCLEHIPDGPGTGDVEKDGWRQENWSRELFVVEKMLDADARNFHAWNYRRYVLAGIPIKRINRSELNYTMKKIESNFSNFSAWHQRTKVLTVMWAEGEADPASTRDKDLDLVKNALYTEPSDQSAWLYHRWLVGSDPEPRLLRREIDVIQELFDMEPDSKWCMESLVHYKRLLLPHAIANERSRLISECRSLLQSLITIDPMRKERYEDIDKSLQ